jgi:D-hexose-6-phosphate mutarotase
MDAEIRTLNTQYAIPEQLSFQADPHGQVSAMIKNEYAEATVSLFGAQVMSFKPVGEADVLWVSQNQVVLNASGMRGGIPVCWPWFAAFPIENPREKPFHGLVRVMPWMVAGSRACPDGATELRLVVRDTAKTLEIWPHAFELEAVITVGQKLCVEWIARNPGSESYDYTGALHPYFRISDIRSITIHGLENTSYLDKTDQYARKTQPGPLQITKETDGIFLDTTSEILIQDPGLERTIHIAKEGSRTTVVWNPDGKDSLMPDVGAGQHRYFVCAEAANAAQDVVSVPPGDEKRLSMTIWTEQGAPS